MAVEQLPTAVREFATYLNDLLARLDQGGGWCGVFWQRDPDGMRACLDGREMPPWDVVEALLHDLATEYGPAATGPETQRARALHTTALAAYDARPGGRDALSDRLDVMLREQRYAAERQAELGRLLASATTQEQADAIRLDLAWARDDHERATARCAELRSRMSDLDHQAAGDHTAAIRRERAGGGGGAVFRIDDGFGADGTPFDGAGSGGVSSDGSWSGGVSSGGSRTDGPRTDGARSGGARSGGPWPDERASYGGGSTSMPHQRDARTAAEAANRHGGRGEAGGRPGPYEGRFRDFDADPADWRDGQRGSAGTADWSEGQRGSADSADWSDGQRGSIGTADWREEHRAADAGSAERYGSPQGRPANPYASGGAAGAASDWPDAQGGGAAAQSEGQSRRPYAARDAEGASDWPDAQSGAAAAPRSEGQSWRPYASRGTQGTSEQQDAQAGAAAAHSEGSPRHPYAAPGAPGDLDWPDPWRGGAPGDAHPDQRPAGRAAHEDAGVDGGPGERSVSVPFEPAPASEPTPKQRKRRRGGARFAGMVEDEAAPVAVPPSAVPTLPAPAATGRRTLRGARFAGAAEVPVERTRPLRQALGAADRREVIESVETLVRLRGEGRSGDAHALLVEAAHWPAPRFPLLAAEMQRAGLGADWATLLWEAASLPADRLVAAADALAAAGRGADGEQILRQGVARPADEIGQAVLGLASEGRRHEVRALLDAYVRVRTPEEAARSAAPGPQTLVPLLVEAARGVSDERHWDLVHALRVAGFTA
jgi:hypothetical protein